MGERERERERERNLKFHFTSQAGEDFKEIEDEVLIFDNETTIQSIKVIILEDNKQEPDEDFFLIMTTQPRIEKRTTIDVHTPVASVLITGNSLHNLSQRFNLLNILN